MGCVVVITYSLGQLWLHALTCQHSRFLAVTASKRAWRGHWRALKGTLEGTWGRENLGRSSPTTTTETVDPTTNTWLVLAPAEWFREIWNNLHFSDIPEFLNFSVIPGFLNFSVIPGFLDFSVIPRLLFLSVIYKSSCSFLWYTRVPAYFIDITHFSAHFIDIPEFLLISVIYQCSWSFQWHTRVHAF